MVETVWHVLWREVNYVGNRGLNMKLLGRRGRGRPKIRYMDVIKENMRVANVAEEDAIDRGEGGGPSTVATPNRKS